MLAVSILLGILAYLPFLFSPACQTVERDVIGVISTIQPPMLFAMLFCTFCKVDPHDLRVTRWHLLLGAFQTTLFLFPALVLIGITHGWWGVSLITSDTWQGWRLVIEAAMLCFICPTATAAAVVTGRLGGDVSSLTSYTLLINLLVALIIPTVVPLLGPTGGMVMDFFPAFALIISRVFPLLVGPLLLAMAIRLWMPSLHARIIALRDLAFYLWAVSLALAIMVSFRSLCASDAPLWVMIAIAAVSLLSCIMQFSFGRFVGHRHAAPIAAGQALGQKNTVFLIWCGYTFFDPLSSIAGGFYSIWHNLWNTYQLSRVATR